MMALPAWILPEGEEKALTFIAETGHDVVREGLAGLELDACVECLENEPPKSRLLHVLLCDVFPNAREIVRAERFQRLFTDRVFPAQGHRSAGAEELLWYATHRIPVCRDLLDEVVVASVVRRTIGASLRAERWFTYLFERLDAYFPVESTSYSLMEPSTIHWDGQLEEYRDWSNTFMKARVADFIYLHFKLNRYANNGRLRVFTALRKRGVILRFRSPPRNAYLYRMTLGNGPCYATKEVHRRLISLKAFTCEEWASAISELEYPNHTHNLLAFIRKQRAIPTFASFNRVGGPLTRFQAEFVAHTRHALYAFQCGHPMHVLEVFLGLLSAYHVRCGAKSKFQMLPKSIFSKLAGFLMLREMYEMFGGNWVVTG